MSLKKIKKEADRPDYISADEGQSVAELRERVREMTRRMELKKEADRPYESSADEGRVAAAHIERVRDMTRRMAGRAGFSREQRGGGTACRSSRVEPHREALPPSMKIPQIRRES